MFISQQYFDFVETANVLFIDLREVSFQHLSSDVQRNSKMLIDQQPLFDNQLIGKVEY